MAEDGGGGTGLERLIPNDPRIRYALLNGKKAIGAKRNQCCDMSTGAIIAHWDDDDWSYPGRLAEQVEALQRGAKCTGYRTIHFYDEESGATHEYIGGPRYVVGTSLCYWRTWWEGHRFPDVRVAEDVEFAVRAAHVMAPLEGIGKMVALTHAGGNTSPRRPNKTQWREVSRLDIPLGFWR